MKIDYSSKKWPKEVENVKKFLKEIGGDFSINEQTLIKRFNESSTKNYLSFYNGLYNTYESMARYYYLNDVANTKCIDYTYLSGLALLCVKRMYDNGIRTEYNFTVEDSLSEFDYALYELIAVDETNFPIFNDDDNLICLMVNQNYDKAKQLIDLLPDQADESKEVYYSKQKYLKNIYKAIVTHDEKIFNEELVKRIKKYRKNMVGYSTIIDIVSIALIKMAKLADIKCIVDVIEIPKMFFDKSYAIDKETVKLPFYDKLLKLNLF